MADTKCYYCNQPMERSDDSDYDWFCDNPECIEFHNIVFIAE
jgi:hypothetical protein